MQRRDDNELGMMEAVVTKMSRIIAHVGIGEKGKHVVQQLQVLSCAPRRSPSSGGFIFKLSKRAQLHETPDQPPLFPTHLAQSLCMVMTRPDLLARCSIQPIQF